MDYTYKRRTNTGSILFKSTYRLQQVFNITYFNQKFAGKYLTINQISGFFRNLSKKIGAKCSPHRFRHRIATELTNNQTNIKRPQHNSLWFE